MHIAHLPTKLSDACNAFRSIKPLMSHETLLLIYHSLFHIVMSYGIIFWGNSCHSMHIFQIQMRVIRIIRDCGNRDSCGRCKMPRCSVNWPPLITKDTVTGAHWHILTMVFSKWIFCGRIIQDPTCGYLWGASEATLHGSVLCVRPSENPEFYTYFIHCH